MDRDKQKGKYIRILQINLGHRAAAHDALMHWLVNEGCKWIICIQEPYFTKRGISQLPTNYGAYWQEQGTTMKRAVIIAPKELQGYMVTQFSNGDCVVVRFEGMNVSIASVYAAIDKNIEDIMKGVMQERQVRKNIICCMDANAYHERWGSIIGRKSKWRCKIRGDELVQIMDEVDMCVCNEPPHPPTFIRDSGKMNSSHIDVTLCSNEIYNRIKQWKVRDDMYGSDHCSISCIYDVYESKEKVEKIENRIPWKKPGRKMKKVMEEALCKSIHGMDKISKVETVERVVGKHVEIIQKVLRGVFGIREGSGRKEKGTDVYWWSEDVNAVYIKMRKARIRMRKYKYDELREKFYEIRREFRSIVREEKIKKWRVFMTEINDPWDKLIKIVKAEMVGKIQSRTLADLHGNFACDMKETLFMLGKQFFPTPMPMLSMHEVIEKEVKDALDVIQAGPAITICEFRKALMEMSKATAPGMDQITNNVIQILATKGKLERKYLKIYNVCLKNSFFPDIWKKSRIVLIPKTSTERNTVKSFRPISLTSSFSKLFERIVLARLLHYLSLSRKMTMNQHAYKKGQSTQTALYDLFSLVQVALNKRGGGFCIAVFLDISGAFDCTWHAGILHKLLMYGVPNYLVAWIRSFLTGRKAYFNEGGENHEVNLEQGCPQGGVLSPILWNVLFNEMLALETEKGESKIDCMKIVGYADDAALVCRALTEESATRMMNKQLEKIRDWAIMNRIKFNPSKLATMVISNRLKRPKPMAIYYDNVLVQEVTTYKYLGLTVDNKLTWSVHINNVINKLALVTKSLRGLSRGNWGLSLEIYRLLFHAIFMPVMTYGIGIWGWKAMNVTTYLKFDKEIRRFGLMATRCQRSTSNVFVFQMLKTMSFANILEFEVLKMSVNQFQITQSLRTTVYETYQNKRKKRIVPQCMDHQFSLYRKGLENKICNVEFDDVNIQYEVHPSQWVLTRTVVSNTVRAIGDGADKRGWVVFTDASMSSYGIGWGFIAFRHGLCKSKGNGALTKCTIFMAEAYAVLQAIRYVNQINGLGQREVVEIRSDAQGLVKKLNKIVQTNVLLHKIKEGLRSARQAGKNIVIRWVPSHKGISGNEAADKLARKGVDSRAIVCMPVIKQDVVNILKERQQVARENLWDSYESRSVKLFLPNLNAVNSFLKSTPSAALCQLVSGHSRLNDFIFHKIGFGKTALCQCKEENETVSHFLFRCKKYNELRAEIWEEFKPEYEFITKDWGKLNEFVMKSGRFDRSIREELFLQGEFKK